MSDEFKPEHGDPYAELHDDECAPGLQGDLAELQDHLFKCVGEAVAEARAAQRTANLAVMLGIAVLVVALLAGCVTPDTPTAARGYYGDPWYSTGEHAFAGEPRR